MAKKTSAALKEYFRSNSIAHDLTSRRLGEYSYDASNYTVRPLAVTFPETEHDLGKILQISGDLKVPVTTRGGGTSMAGNAVGSGVIVDVSRNMTEIGELDENEQSIWVGAGVVLSELRAHVEKATSGRLTFAPDPSSMSRATVGGAMGNDACGNHSVKYGRMSNHVLEAEIISANGALLHATKTGLKAVNPSDQFSKKTADDITHELKKLAGENLAIFRTELERIPRQVSGYQLSHLLPERNLNVVQALMGSEGTCALITRAKVRLVEKEPYRSLLCVGYKNTIEAARDIEVFLESAPSAIEGLDTVIVQNMRQRRGADSVSTLPRGTSFVLIEFSSTNNETHVQEAEELLQKIKESGRYEDSLLVTDEAEIRKLWRIREDGAGLSSKTLDGQSTWPGWEDAAVAPKDLANYLEELLPLVEEFGYKTALYGHFGDGCVHMRINFDFHTKEGIKKYRSFVEQAADIVVKHGGTLSGEHGDGRARSELLSRMYSVPMMNAFMRFKAIWDSENILNPGIIVNEVKMDDSLLYNSAKQLPILDQLGNFHSCIGVGRCRATSGGFMCPSYRASKDEKDSTRGRARVLQSLSTGEATDKMAMKDIEEALDLCLSCKACSSDCPTGVDMADTKSRFLDLKYKNKLRPVSHYAIGQLPKWRPLISRFSGIVNIAKENRALRFAGEKLGVSSKRRMPDFVSNKQYKKALDDAGFETNEKADVVLFVDSFTKAFRPELIGDVAEVVQSTGQTVGCEADSCCGLTWVSTGQREGATKRMAKLVENLDDGSDKQIVVPEPSCAATIKDEAPKLLGSAAASRVAARIETVSTYLSKRIKNGWKPPQTPIKKVVLQTHCHENAVFGSAQQKDVLNSLGVENIVESSSCCGVAGNFGFESEHFDMSMKVSEHSIKPALEEGADAEVVLTDGFSCGMQVSQIDEAINSKHLASVIKKFLPGEKAKQ